MTVIITIIHVFVAIALIMIVLLQTGKGADMGLAFGGGSSQTLFGTTGASTFLSKATTVIAIVFMLTTFSLTIMWGKRNDSSIMTDFHPPVQNTAPATANESQQTDTDKVQPPTDLPAQAKKDTTEQAVMETQVLETPSSAENSSSQPIKEEISIPDPDKTE
jgi:preprotein translocase subunit SecG